MINKQDYSVAYLSMEIAIENNIKTYAGGLGVLAGDILRSATEKKFPMVGITLFNRQGYFKQKIKSDGTQVELIDPDFDFDLLKKIDTQIEIHIGTDIVKVAAWQYRLRGADNFITPIFFLDTNISGNKKEHKTLSTRLYGGDLEFRLRQEIVLGMGGIKMLQALGYNNIKYYHINEGHGAFAGVELFLNTKEGSAEEKINVVKKQCVFTTHTPIKTIYDEFPLDVLLKNIPNFPSELKGLIKDNRLNTLNLGMYFSNYINGVSKAHQALLNNIFPDSNIQSVTNGVSSTFWTAASVQNIFDHHLDGWRSDKSLLKRATIIPSNELWSAHQTNKKKLLDYINIRKKIDWDEKVLTIGFARRFTNYKQPLLLFSDVERLLDVLETNGQAQIVIAGKAHRRDTSGQEAIKKIYQIKKQYPKLKIVFLENYNLDLARLLVAGVDIWLNTPLPPQEACGTSGMKAAHNGVPQVSTLDGWWPEGYVKNKTGWVINTADELYQILKIEILPLYYYSPGAWRELMKNTISLNASYFNSDRALEDYIRQAYK